MSCGSVYSLLERKPAGSSSSTAQVAIVVSRPSVSPQKYLASMTYVAGVHSASCDHPPLEALDPELMSSAKRLNHSPGAPTRGFALTRNRRRAA